MSDKKKCKKCVKEEERLRQALEEMTEQAKRATADLVNYKRRTEEDKKNFVEFANAGLVLELLPILDNFERATNHIPENSEKTIEFNKGILTIYEHLQEALKKTGLTEISVENDSPFDPNLHEALMQGPGPQNQITEVLEKGYMLGSRVLRPAKVKVGDGS